MSEVIDGEAIIMDMGSGSYYSADGVGALIWNAVVNGSTDEDVIAWTASSFPEQDAGAGAASGFLDQLIHYGLMRHVDAAATRVALAPMTCAWSPPSLQRHTDMEDLIMIDPIHDVDEVGWPVRKVD